MAVLVQPALRPAASGVLAAEIVDGRCVSWSIEAVRGLAEPLVNGTLTGELHTGRLHVEDLEVFADQKIIYVPGTPDELQLPPGEWANAPGLDGEVRAKIATSRDGIVHLHAPREWRSRRILDVRERNTLLDYAVTAAAALGVVRVDVEWAVSAGSTGMTLLQARPLTRPLHSQTLPTGGTRDGWSGLPAVPGIASGPAAFLADGTQVAGTVLISGALGPESVDAMLQRPAALVATTGGTLSHTAIIARELGIPCVTNVTGIAGEISPGTLLEVDGAEGTVRLAASLPSPRAARPVSAVGAGVVVRRLPSAPATDGRAATVLLHGLEDPGALEAVQEAAAGNGPCAGVLLVDVLDPVLPGFTLLPVAGIGRLLWPEGADAPPSRLVVLGPDTEPLFERRLLIEGAL